MLHPEQALFQMIWQNQNAIGYQGWWRSGKVCDYFSFLPHQGMHQHLIQTAKFRIINLYYRYANIATIPKTTIAIIINTGVINFVSPPLILRFILPEPVYEIYLTLNFHDKLYFLYFYSLNQLYVGA